jgi:hypothetical protein
MAGADPSPNPEPSREPRAVECPCAADEGASLVGRDVGEPPALFDLLLRRIPPERVLRPRTTGEVVTALRK